MVRRNMLEPMLPARSLSHCDSEKAASRQILGSFSAPVSSFVGLQKPKAPLLL
jgi:hypothetical protein